MDIGERIHETRTLVYIRQTADQRATMREAAHADTARPSKTPEYRQATRIITHLDNPPRTPTTPAEQRRRDKARHKQRMAEDPAYAEAYRRRKNEQRRKQRQDPKYRAEQNRRNREHRRNYTPTKPPKPKQATRLPMNLPD